MKLREHGENWEPWGQIGKAKIGYEWVRGIALFRNSGNTLVLFEVFGSTRALIGPNHQEASLKLVARPEFKIDAPATALVSCHTD